MSDRVQALIEARLWLDNWKDDGVLVDIDTGQELTEARFESQLEAEDYIKANNLPIYVVQVRNVNLY